MICYENLRDLTRAHLFGRKCIDVKNELSAGTFGNTYFKSDITII